MSYRVAVVGATGNVGREILDVLAERKFPVSDVYAIASDKSIGKKVSFGDSVLDVESINSFDFSKVDIALFSAGSAVSEKFAPTAAKHAIVIDNTSHFRTFDDIPLVIPEVNPEAIAQYTNRNIISNPNCAVMQLLIALKPLHDHIPIKRVVITTFQSVSGAGKSAMDELFLQTKSKYMNEALPSHVFPKQIAFNIIPKIGDFDKDGNSAEELKIVAETKKILDPSIEVSATCVRVPVFAGHSESVNIEFDSYISAQEASSILSHAKGVILHNRESFITPIECVGDDEVYVSRIRQDNSKENALNMWIVSDNLRKGAALNAVQIAEELVKHYI